MSNNPPTVASLHRAAMELGDQSFVARRYGNRAEYLRLTELAFEKEAAAADLMVDDIDIEPTRSVLHRSAATLAWRCELYADAKRLICRGLAGKPPPEIEEELLDLQKKVDAALENAEPCSQTRSAELNLETS